MRIRDLGRLEGDVLLFGGPYSNLQATQALFDLADHRGIPRSNRICTGDIAAYCADPAATIAEIRHRGGPVVAGNMELQLAQGGEDCGCGFQAGTACDLMSGAWFAHVNSNVSAEDRDWMAGCAERVVFRHAGRRCVVLHGAASDVARFVWPATPNDVLSAEWELAEQQVGPVDMIISGHSGIPFLRDTGRGTWLNAGVIGMPPHDGTPQTRFAVLGQDGAHIETLDYDWQEAAAAMRREGLVQGYEKALETGYWPSEDVLPSDMRSLSRASG